MGELLYFLKVFRTAFGSYISQSNYSRGEFSLLLSKVGCGECFLTGLGCGVVYLCGVATVMVRDTAHSAGDGENITLYGLFVFSPKCEKKQLISLFQVCVSVQTSPLG